MTPESHAPVAAGKSSFDLIDPDRVFPALPLAPGAAVLDLACGPGHYALELARRQPALTVHALDLWAEGVGRLMAAARAAGLTAVSGTVADATGGLPLRAGCIDLCLAATVLHDLTAEGTAGAALAEIARVLRPGGVLAALEFHKVESRPGPPREIRLAPAELAALAEPHGFRRRLLQEAGEHLYLMLFERS